ncbi:peptide deformylase [Candidatus Stoquefichus massiliensis]|uniref:peptide deformylase n=1 Tax=Candidatus Stoquefichus massiliensis TaxID=1470350 RepID=UPI00048888C2|nr:peptide deformylase [Candidatus Stoquefichus massiliensis]
MLREIITDQFLLSGQSTEATKDDLYIVQDLKDTMHSRQEFCVGMAANMINEHKRIIIVMDNSKELVMINPIVMKTSGRHYEAEEACLCHQGTKKTKRYEKIKVQYYDENFKIKIKTFSDVTAQIIQHEIDHCNGILI